MTPLTVDVLRVFFAVVVVAAITTIAAVSITNTHDIDSMADPEPRLGEPDHQPPALQRAQAAWYPERGGWDQQ